MTKIPHIKVDAFALVDDHFSGIGHYTAGIIGGFDELAAEGKLTYSLIAPRHWTDRVNKFDLHHYKRVIPNPVPNRAIRGFLWENLKFPMDSIFGKGDYYFSSFLAWPHSPLSTATVVIHDITYEAVPECVSEGNRKYLQRVVPHSLENANNIITVSEFSKREVVKHYKADPEKIKVAYPCVDRKHFYRRSKEEIKKVRARYDIFSEKYMLTVGNVEPRKSYDRLIEAYMKLPKRITDEYPLVIVGGFGWDNQHILDKMQEAKEKGYRVIHPRMYVPDDDMPALFSGASCYLFTPIYEGFGMSPLEAYACGTPVVASNNSSVPEAAGKAAIYTDPYDINDMAKKIEQMIKKVEKDPHQFDEAMSKHLESFSWRKSAEITASVITGLPLEHFQK